ncbi:MAG: hypothetical protein O2U61_03245 [Candidatus Bathyarchaeota archaeon]|nr:hypothetical protein [Candidatus Bathyarchaeota archaeon]MCZ2845503.1 hypothetical protein [Candidatus Bathyarchaeota archaeon]
MSKFKLDNLNKSEILKIAKRFYFSMGVDDGSSFLCRRNMCYGLSKILWAQENIGMEPNATFVSSPDESITRNSTRWNNGIGYGGKLSWGDGRSKIIFLDSMPNACGMLVGTLDNLPDPKHLIDRIIDIERKSYFVNDVEIEWDFEKGNHFIDVFSLKKFTESELPDYAFVIHGGTHEFKGDNPHGMGLYYHQSKILKEMFKTIETPFGNTKVLFDNDVEDYMKLYKIADDFSKKKRLLIAELIFGDFNVITNPNHQALINYNQHLLGVNDIKDPSANGLFPVMLKADLPGYIMKGKNNINDEVIEAIGFLKRAEDLGIYHRLSNANILPHGGGYKLKDISNVVDVIEAKSKRYFICDMTNDMGLKILSNFKEVEFTYRGKEVMIRTLELGLGEPIAKLIPNYVLKV